MYAKFSFRNVVEYATLNFRLWTDAPDFDVRPSAPNGIFCPGERLYNGNLLILRITLLGDRILTGTRKLYKWKIYFLSETRRTSFLELYSKFLKFETRYSETAVLNLK